MRFLANENFPLPSVRRLRLAGHDVTAAAESCPGATDREVLRLPEAESRILLTFDQDYGEMIYRMGLPSPAGVVLLRLGPISPEEPAELLLLSQILGTLTFESWFTVIQRTQVRQRPLPPQPEY